jgi:hypothetical protein
MSNVRRHKDTRMNLSHVTVITALLIAACRGAVAAEAIEPVAVETRLFLSHSGKFSEPISEKTELWNTPATSDSPYRPSRNTFVRVQVNGPPGGADMKGRVDLTVTTVGTNQRPTRMHQRLGVFGPDGKQFVGFWLPDTGCEALQLSAKTNTSHKVVTQSVPFKCGE